MPGPLSMPCQDKAKFHLLDTAAKRDDAGDFTTGKTEKNHRKPHNGRSIDSAPKNLARRIRQWEATKDMHDNPGAFHRPGSNKK